MYWIRMAYIKEPLASIIHYSKAERDLSVCQMKYKVNLKSLIGSDNYCFACKPTCGIGVYKTLTVVHRDL